jgi:hypothetical protein
MKGIDLTKRFVPLSIEAMYSPAGNDCDSNLNIALPDCQSEA